jgi:TonB family protein
LISHNIKWFLGLSLAVHAVMLLGWQQTDHEAGNTGQALLLSITNRAGEAVRQTVTSEEKTATDDVLPAQQPAPSPGIAAARLKQQRSATVAVSASTLPPTVTQETTALSAQAALSSSSATPSREETDRHLRACVMELITRQLTYPAIARRKGWQGVVKLELHIESDGLISALHIDETSGYAVLDRAAMESLQLASIPDAVRWLDGAAVDIVVPVEYRLIGS